MKEALKNKKVLTCIGLVIFVIVFLISSFMDRKKQEELEAEKERIKAEMKKEIEEAKGEVSDNMLLNMQNDLINSYGNLPDGYIWDIDGSLLSLGDKDMSAEDVVYAYLNGLRTLDMSMVQKYSRESTVIETYSNYFDEQDKNTDYTDQFLRNMYREALLSMEVVGIDNSSVFAQDKQVFTVTVNMLDLTQKDFWEPDKDVIYKNLKIYDSNESDSTKANIYLYNYILSYYKSDNAKTRDVSFDLTVQKYPDLDTGWLVSIDTDVDSACRYADGKLVVSYINERYLSEGLKYLDNLENAKSIEEDLEEDEVKSKNEVSDDPYEINPTESSSMEGDEE